MNMTPEQIVGALSMLAKKILALEERCQKLEAAKLTGRPTLTAEEIANRLMYGAEEED